MALASYFERTAQGAAQVLHDFDEQAFRDQLDAEVVAVEFDSRAAGTTEGRATLDLLVRLLSRLYPRLVVRGADPDVEVQLRTLALSINSSIELVEDHSQATVAACVGETFSPAGRVIYAGSDGWLARVRTSGPVGCGETSNPFGAGAAACLAAANVFRLVFAASLKAGHVDDDACFSLLDFATQEAANSGPSIVAVPLGTLQLVGCGAIGNGALWALSRVSGLAGRIELIDPEPVDLSNLQRYVMTTGADVGVVKVELGRRILEHQSLEVVPFHGSWADYLSQRKDWHLDRVAVALDTAKDRIAVQASLPRWIANAWTQPGDLGLSRHGFVGEEACMACLYLPPGQVRNEDELVAAALGMPDQLLRIRELLYRGDPVGEDLAREVSDHLRLPPDLLTPFVGRPLRDFYTQGICGAASLYLQDTSRKPVDVPMAFQSAMAGLMLAAEVVATVGGLRDQNLPTKTTIDLMRPLSIHLSSPVAKLAVGTGPRCICQDSDYIERYHQKYDAAPLGS